MSAQAAVSVKARPPTFRASARNAELNLERHAIRRLTGLVLTVVTVCSALVFLGYHSGSRSAYRRTRTLAAAATTADSHARGQVEATKLSPATNPSSSTFPPLKVPGFVLQVGAMTNESNAQALSEALQRNNFPAFVFKRSTDRFYQVNVGSFADADFAAVVKRKLQKKGFKSILRYWSP
jgi:septal ring-binding cell division protein DamX